MCILMNDIDQARGLLDSVVQRLETEFEQTSPKDSEKNNPDVTKQSFETCVSELFASLRSLRNQSISEVTTRVINYYINNN